MKKKNKTRPITRKAPEKMAKPKLKVNKTESDPFVVNEGIKMAEEEREVHLYPAPTDVSWRLSTIPFKADDDRSTYRTNDIFNYESNRNGESNCNNSTLIFRLLVPSSEHLRNK